jgi:ribosomal protein S18 acetylase RimI-like enzyme
MADVEVREATVADAGAMAGLWRDTGEHLAALEPDVFQVPEADGLSDFFRGLLSRPRPADVARLVATAGGDVVGAVQAHVENPVDFAGFQVQRQLARHRLYVDSLAVAQSARRRGVGRLLMTAIEEWGRDRGAMHVVLDTFARSPLSVPFYRHLGYEEHAIIFHRAL